MPTDLQALARLWRRMFKPCAHDWLDLYGDQIFDMGARSVCRRCGKRSQKLMEYNDAD